MRRLVSTKSASPLDIDMGKRKQTALALAGSFVIRALLVIGLLFLLISFRVGIEALHPCSATGRPRRLAQRVECDILRTRLLGETTPEAGRERCCCPAVEAHTDEDG